MLRTCPKCRATVPAGQRCRSVTCSMPVRPWAVLVVLAAFALGCPGEEAERPILVDQSDVEAPCIPYRATCVPVEGVDDCSACSTEAP